MGSLNNQVALITGASRGIGRATAIAFAKEGVHVALLARDQALLEEVANECAKHKVKTLVLPCDIKDVKALKEHVEKTYKELGNIHILVNNAGVSAKGSAENADLEAWDRAIDINLRSLMHITRYTAPYIAKNNCGAIINIASVASKMSFAQSGAYCATKHGVLGFSNSVFEDMREKNIKVCSICPGFVNTDMVGGPGVDKNKMIQPEDIAQTVLFVAKFPDTGCPTEIVLRPQKSPYK